MTHVTTNCLLPTNHKKSPLKFQEAFFGSHKYQESTAGNKASSSFEYFFDKRNFRQQHSGTGDRILF